MKYSRKQERQRGRRSGLGRTRGLWMALVAVVLALGGLLAFAAQSRVAEAGVLVAEPSLQDVGEVNIHGGLVQANFPLEVHGETRVTGITTS